MGFDPITGPLLAGASGAIGFLGNQRAAEATDQATEYQSHLLGIQADNEREALRTNRRRKKEDRDRYLSRVRLEQINSGAGMSGSNQLVFDDITSRLDERIDDMTESHLAQIGRIEQSQQMTHYQGRQSKAAARMNAASSLIGGAAGAFRYYQNVTSKTTPGEYKGVWSLFS